MISLLVVMFSLSSSPQPQSVDELREPILLHVVNACLSSFPCLVGMVVVVLFLFLFQQVDGDVPYRPTAEAADAAQVEEDEDDDAIAARRARVRERLRARRAAEAEVLEVEQEDINKCVFVLRPSFWGYVSWICYLLGYQPRVLHVAVGYRKDARRPDNEDFFL